MQSAGQKDLLIVALRLFQESRSLLAQVDAKVETACRIGEVAANQFRLDWRNLQSGFCKLIGEASGKLDDAVTWLAWRIKSLREAEFPGMDFPA